MPQATRPALRESQESLGQFGGRTRDEIELSEDSWRCCNARGELAQKVPTMTQFDWVLTKLETCQLQTSWIRLRILENNVAEALKHLDLLEEEIKKMKERLDRR